MMLHSGCPDSALIQQGWVEQGQDAKLSDLFFLCSIFQIAGDLVMAANTEIQKQPPTVTAAGLTVGGVRTENIFWQVAGAVTIGVNSHFEGVTLCSTAINVRTEASINGRLLAQTEVTLQKNTITKP